MFVDTMQVLNACRMLKNFSDNYLVEKGGCCTYSCKCMTIHIQPFLKGGPLRLKQLTNTLKIRILSETSILYLIR